MLSNTLSVANLGQAVVALTVEPSYAGIESNSAEKSANTTLILSYKKI